MLKGIDISTWQGVGTGDGDYDFVIVKATEGVGYTDPKCDQHYQRAKAQGKLLGVYHFARPGYNTPEAEADWFVSQIKGYIGEAILVLDWEVEATWNVNWAKRWLDRVYEKTGVKPMIYMSASVVNGNDWSAVIKGDYGLWIAGYPNKYNVANPPMPSVDDMPYGLGGWPFWAIWQYSSSAGRLDLDIANLDRDAWMKYAAKSGSTPAPAPTPTPAPAPAPSPSKDYEEYVVQSGDTLSAIAAKYGTTYQKIAADNGIANPNLIFPGQRLKIYKSGGGNSGSSSNVVDYAVRRGDTLSAIAARYGTTWQKIAKDNNLSNPNLIFPGQRLKIYL